MRVMKPGQVYTTQGSAYLRQLRLAGEVQASYHRRLRAAGFVVQGDEVHCSGVAEGRLAEELWRQTIDEFMRIGK